MARKPQWPDKGRRNAVGSRHGSPGSGSPGRRKQESTAPGRCPECGRSVASHRRRRAQEIARWSRSKGTTDGCRGTPKGGRCGQIGRKVVVWVWKRMMLAWMGGGGGSRVMIVVGISVFSHARGGRRRSIVQGGSADFRRAQQFGFVGNGLNLVGIRSGGRRRGCCICIVVHGKQSERQGAEVLALLEASLNFTQIFKLTTNSSLI